MAPEQKRGEAVDQRADVYAIGVMLWELCTVQKIPPATGQLRRRLLAREGIFGGTRRAPRRGGCGRRATGA